MRNVYVSILLVSLLSGCSGPGEPLEARMYGVRKSAWDYMSPREREAAMSAYTADRHESASLAQLETVREERWLEHDRRRRLRDDELNVIAYRLTYRYPSRTTIYYQDPEYVHLLKEDQYRMDALVNKLRRENNDLKYRQQKENELNNELKYREKLLQKAARSANDRAYSQEQRDIAKAKRRSIQTYHSDNARRQEQRDIAEAKRRSIQTYHLDNARRQEQRDIADAKNCSIQTYHLDNARRQEQADLEEALRRSITEQ